MPDYKNASPLLDGLTVGDPMSSHFGISCSPAIRDSADNRYIVKCISIPQSQAQVDALLITGACKDLASCAEYFRQLADEVCDEASLLEKLSRLEGFMPFLGCQAVPMDNEVPGYDIYLLSKYRLSLDKYMRRHGLTQLEAVNLGIDMCAALTACRRAGLLYIDLKPTNIYITPKKEFRIGDLGFAAMSSLKFSPMPVKYRSPYTAPELLDDLSVLNETTDTYALGTILYQVFNCGQLPADPKAPTAPVKADEEMAGIILKACAPNAEDRWQHPTEMWKALVAYMQGNTITKNQVMPPIGMTGGTSTMAKFQITHREEEPAAEPEAPAPTPAETEAAQETAAAEKTEAAAPAEPAAEEAAAAAENVPAAEPEAPAPQEPADAPQAPEQPAEPEEDPTQSPDFQNDWNFDPVQEKQDFENELEEVNKLISTNLSSMPKLQTPPRTEPIKVKKEKKHIGRKILTTLLVLILLAALSFCGYTFYNEYYIQNVEGIAIEGSDNRMSVTVQSAIPDDLLTVVCVDAYGATVRQDVHGKTAVFTDLKPGSLYKIHVEISGLHKLTGNTTGIFTTETVTNVVSMTATTGAADGTVMLNLTVEGHEPEQWIVYYVCDTETEKSQTFSGHNVTISDLAVGERYTFRLEAADGSPITGQNVLVYDASSLVIAEDLTVLGVRDGVMEISWKAPEGVAVEGWNVRCFSNTYDESQETSGTAATFSGINTSEGYTIEVTAKGMTQPARTTVTANPITLTDVRMNDSDPKELVITWDSVGGIPQGGWLLLYTVDDNPTPTVIKCASNSASISPRVPGAAYAITIQAPEDVTIFNSTHNYASPTPGLFVGHAISAHAITAQLLPTPDAEKWSFVSIPASAYTNTFSRGESISIVLKVSTNFYLDNDPVYILYVIRDSEGRVIPELTASADANWAHLWAKEDYHYAELNATKAPSEAGSYTLDLYFDGKVVSSTPFTVS